MRTHEQIDEQRLDRRRIVADLVIARRLRPAQLQPVERRLAGNGRAFLVTARLELAGQHRQHRIMAQLVMVVQVLVAERQREDALADKRLHLMLDRCRPAGIHETAGKAADQPDRPVRQPQQKRAGIGGDSSTVKTDYDGAPFNRCKIKPFRYTLCLHRGIPLLKVSLCRRSIFLDSEPRCTSTV
ncbi:hypothetical protein X765_29085 [Mesorhizobium sp. LSHC440B00]|nr:hypothetical protein X765_29085 [Mesorhizobium sp. LSHC440B00]